MQGLEKYNEWCKQNAGKYWVATEPCPYEFVLSPWEGEFSYNSVGEYVQYRDGKWEKVNETE